MKIENLKNGMIVKNYKELCSILEVPVKVGKSRILQLQDFERYFKYHKIGNKFVIDEVFNVANAKIDKRKDPSKISNNSMYSKDIQALIIDVLAQSKDNSVYLSTNAFLRKLDMINDNYSVGRKFIPRLSELTEVPQAYCYDFYYETNIKLRDKLETALNGLRKRALVMWTHSTTVCMRVAEDVDFNEFAEIALKDKNKVSFKVKEIHCKADEDQQKLILRVERETLKKMGYASIKDVYLARSRWKEFKDTVNKILLEKANIEYYYKSYEVIYNHDHIVEAKTLKLGNEKKEEIKNNLNSNISKFVLKNAKTTKNRLSKKEIVSAVEFLRTTDSYLDNTQILTDVVINRNAKDIRKELTKAANKSETKKVTNAKALAIQKELSRLYQVEQINFEDYFEDLPL